MRALGSILLGAALVRLIGIGGDSLWADEIRSYRLAAIPLDELFQRIFVRRDLLLPLGPVLLAKLSLACGGGEVALRLPYLSTCAV